MVVIMLTKWERKILLDKLHDFDVNPDHLRVVKYRVKKRLKRALADTNSFDQFLLNYCEGRDYHQNLPVKITLGITILRIIRRRLLIGIASFVANVYNIQTVYKSCESS